MWIGDKYIYTRTKIVIISKCYFQAYGINYLENQTIAEERADFDRALNAIGRGRWRGYKGQRFRSFYSYGRLQQIVIADLLGITDYELKQKGFWNISIFRKYAYHLMADFLNGEGKWQ